MLKISLFVNGRVVSEVNEVGDREISIGRSPGCVVRIPDPTVSRLHAAINKTADGFVLEKKTSVGSLLLNGTEVENAVLQGGEEIEIANVILRVNFEDEPEVDADAQTGAMDMNQMSGAAPTPASFGDDVIGDDGATKVLGPSQALGMLRFEPGAANHIEFTIKKDLVLVGRASNCDVVIFEKRASRKHFEIRREGLSFYVRDLDSANGMKVNEQETKQAELVPGDVIRVGETKIEFTVENKEFFKQQDQFIPVPQEAMPAGGMATIDPARNQVGMPVDGAPTDGAEPEEDLDEEQSLLKKRWKQFKKLPRTTRLLILAGLVVFIPFLLEEEPDKKPKKPPIQRDAQGNPIITIDRLPPEEQELVRKAYKATILAKEQGDYEKMLREINVVLSKVTKYRDSEIYKKQALKGIEEKERQAREEKKKKFEEKLRKEVAKLVIKGNVIFEEALEDKNKRPILDDMIQEIFSKDPNNNSAQLWQNRIKEKIQQEADEERRKAAEKALKEQAERAFAKLEQIIFDGKYIEALKFADQIPKQIKYRGDNYLARVQEKKQEVKAKINSIIGPLLERAKREREPGGDLVKSKDLYREVLKTDPANREANEGLLAIRSVLHLRAKRLYAQAILAESISQLEEAEQKYQKCLRVAPERDPYQRRCKAKLLKFEAFSKE